MAFPSSSLGLIVNDDVCQWRSRFVCGVPNLQVDLSRNGPVMELVIPSTMLVYTSRYKTSYPYEERPSPHYQRGAVPLPIPFGMGFHRARNVRPISRCMQDRRFHHVEI